MPVTATNLLVGVGAVVIEGANIGGTRGGVILQRETEVKEIDDVDQVMGVADVVKFNEKWSIRTELAEATLVNLEKALELENPAVANVQDFGGDADHASVTLTFYGTAPGGYQRTVAIYKARVIEVGEIPFRRDDATVIPVTFRLINDLSKASGKQIGQITDATS